MFNLLYYGDGISLSAISRILQYRFEYTKLQNFKKTQAG